MRSKTSLSKNATVLLAISALDELVVKLVKATQLKTSPEFLDWIADEATPLVERCVTRSLRQVKFTQSLQVGDPKIALTCWVRQWIGPLIVANFKEFAAYLPEFAASWPVVAWQIPVVLPGATVNAPHTLAVTASASLGFSCGI
jgi:hypothetical protein